MKFFHLFIFIFVFTSCVRPLEPQFTDTHKSIEDRVLSLEEIQEARCTLQTGEPVQENIFKSSAQRFVVEDSQEMRINNFPHVEYQIEGSPVCHLLLGQSQIELAARPHSSYPVSFQVIGSMIRVLIEGDFSNLPSQHLTSASRSDRILIPIGGYSVEQGEVRQVRNVVGSETHILNFYPNENQPFEKTEISGTPHWIRKNVSHVLISNLNGGFQRFEYADKTDVFPKDYFEGIWYAGVSMTSAEPLSSGFGFSGYNVSGDSYSGFTSGQKIYFEFESDYIRAFNQNYKDQSQQRQAIHLAEAEVLSFPIEHLDYRVASEGPFIEGGMREEIHPYRTWQEARYVKIDFSRVDHFFSKILNSLSTSADSVSLNLKTDSVTVREIRVAPRYFDLLVYDGQVEYRFSFLKKPESSSYKPRTLASVNHNFEYFYQPDTRIFTEQEQTFRRDYRNNVLIHRLQPDANNEIVLHFSSLTPSDEKIRSLGREAVSLWNQALHKARLSFRLRLDESQDVELGDLRYNVLNLPLNLNRGALGMAPSYVDDETGQVISTTTNVYLTNVIESLKFGVIQYSYRKHGLNIQFMGTPPLLSSVHLPLSRTSLDYFSFQNKLNQIKNPPLLPFPSRIEDFSSYIHQTKQVHQSMTNSSPHVFFEPSLELSQDPLYKQWTRRFKKNYALQTGEFLDHQPFREIQHNMKSWRTERWEESVGSGGSLHSHLDQVLDKFCPDISVREVHPLDQSENFKVALNECVDKIYLVYALGTTVHELGHSIFSLSHNFAGSFDGKNFNSKDSYQIHFLNPYLAVERSDSLITDFFPQISSSVMDYIDFSHGEQWAPGPYDVAAIEFLYSDQQEPSSENSFLRCSDWSVNDSSYCFRFDSSLTPEGQVQKIIEELFYSLDYNFGRVYNPASEYRVYYNLSRLMTFYYDWRKRLNSYMVKNRLDLNRLTSLEDHEQVIRGIVQRGSSPSASPEDKELLSFYRVRNLIYHALTYFSFIPNRYCVLKEKPNPESPSLHQETRVLLEISKVVRFKENQNYVLSEDIVSCWADASSQHVHPFVQEYIDQIYPFYELEDERGYFLQTYQTPKNLTYQGLDPAYHVQYQGTLKARLMAFSALFLTEYFYPKDSSSYQERSPFIMMNEKDMENGLERLVMARAAKGVFFPTNEDFFKALEEVPLEELTPKRSAEILFGFPPYEEGDKDLVFKDDFIELEKLHQGSQNPYKRDDFIETKFYQNFHEEQELLKVLGSFYSTAKILAGGNYMEEISNQVQELYSNIQTGPSSTKTLLVDKSMNSLAFNHSPERAATYHYENGLFYLTPSKDEESLNSVSNILISELSLNTLREMMTDHQYRKSFLTRVNGEFAFEQGFTTFTMTFLKMLLNFQHLRLGRFYFIYAYTLILGTLESYEEILNDSHFDNPQEVRQAAQERMDIFVKTMERLFYYPKCGLVGTPFQLYGLDIENDPPSEVRDQLIRGLNQVWKQNCSGEYAKRGKLQALFTSQNYINHEAWARDNKRSFLFPSEFQAFEEVHDQKQTYRNHIQLDKEVAAFNHQINIPLINFLVSTFFLNFFDIYENDLKRTQKVIRFNRNLLLDVVPKMMLMYSPDRKFVGEMLYIMANIYSQCTSEFQPNIHLYCQLITEKTLSYYFSGKVYGTDRTLESYYFNHVVGRPFAVDSNHGGIPLNVLVQKEPVYYQDTFINPGAFNTRAIVDFMFFKRNWSFYSNTTEEVLAQREFLLTLLPVAPVQVRSF